MVIEVKCACGKTLRANESLIGQTIQCNLCRREVLVPDPQAKQALRRTSGAAAVDTESHIVAGVAAAHRLPFVAFRVVADSVRRTLPPAVHVAALGDLGGALGAALLAKPGRR